jgi:hypothetical protein
MRVRFEAQLAGVFRALGFARLRISSSVSLSFNGTATFSSQSGAPSVLRMSPRSTDTSFSLLPPTATT